MIIRQRVPCIEAGNSVQFSKDVAVLGDNDAPVEAFSQLIQGNDCHAPCGFADGCQPNQTNQAYVFKRAPDGLFRQHSGDRFRDDLICMLSS